MAAVGASLLLCDGQAGGGGWIRLGFGVVAATMREDR
jgi:hypothetical protein